MGSRDRRRSEILDFLRAREVDTARQTVHVFAHEVTAAQAGRPHGKSVHHQFRRTGGKQRITRRTSRPLHPTV
ncbi:hypothetical protein [Streptomyces coeruleorubidus]|uniref:hypothetical protein n=1 Tax=Streptomyces coeruleorubidus TaxID=116188 RepID=UPI001874D496|nr:hypothetical protein [Streptomyces bellus]